jgi:hypothetical protein
LAVGSKKINSSVFSRMNREIFDCLLKTAVCLLNYELLPLKLVKNL